MKFITSIATLRRAPAICALLGTLMLSACGGGGGGGGGGASAPVATTPTVTSFAQVTAMPNFSWSTSKALQPAVGISRSSGAALGELTLLVSNYTCVDPTSGGGARLHFPLRDGLLTSYSLNAAEQAATKVTWNQLGLQTTAATNLLLIELVEGNSTIYSKLVQPSALATLSITLTDVPAAATCN